MSAEMKMLKNLLFTLILLVGCSFAAFGQSNPPPKENPPVVPVKPKETPKPAPKPTPKPNSEIIGSGRFSQEETK